MLLELRIRNFAIIDQVELEFGPGLNVLSGETGAGKTIIMNALGLLLGMRASPEMVRADQKEAVVDGLFQIEGEGLGADLPEGFDAASGELIVKRVVSESGRSRVLINDEMATVQTLARIGAALVEVYGQHEQQSLLRTENHLTILDRFAALQTSVAVYRGAYARARELDARLANLEQRARDRERRLETAKFELEELDRAHLDAGEEREPRGRARDPGQRRPADGRGRRRRTIADGSGRRRDRTAGPRPERAGRGRGIGPQAGGAG